MIDTTVLSQAMRTPLDLGIDFRVMPEDTVQRWSDALRRSPGVVADILTTSSLATLMQVAVLGSRCGCLASLDHTVRCTCPSLATLTQVTR